MFPQAGLVALPCGILAGVLKYLSGDDGKIVVDFLDINTLSGNQAWKAFTGLAGFFIVFRTKEANSRFWEACTSAHKMRTQWFLAASTVFAYTRLGKMPREKCWQFQSMFIRLMSMLNAMSLAELEEINAETPDNHHANRAFKYDLIDPEGIDAASLRYLAACDSKVELLVTWICNLLVQTRKDNIIEIPDPVMSRIIDAMEIGTSAFYDAVRITEIPFPFPYAQACDFLLVIHWLVAPVLAPQWSNSKFWTAFFVFLQVFILWSLKAIASEIEVPFGTRANDLSGEGLQHEMNTHLLLLLDASEGRGPTMSPVARPIHRSDTDVVMMSFDDVWEDLGEVAVAACRRRGHTIIPSGSVMLNMNSAPAFMNGKFGDVLDDPNGTPESKGPRLPVKVSRV